jgi:hypothetical protein
MRKNSGLDGTYPTTRVVPTKGFQRPGVATDLETIENAMELDPATVCVRTPAGEAELQVARSGLTLPQRKVLSLIVAPQPFAELAALHHMEPARLGRDLARLAELGLIWLHLPAARVARLEAAQSFENVRRQGAMLGVGRQGRWPVPAIVIAVAVATAAGISWFAWRDALTLRPAFPKHVTVPAVEPARATAAANAAMASTGVAPLRN